MPPEEIRLWLRQQPFRPFRVWVLEKLSYDIPHPEFVITKIAAIELMDPFDPSEEYIVRHTIACRHITRLERLGD